MIPEAGFIFSIAGLSASFAGLAGLVMALRRGSEVRPIDSFRLRQMVEFSFANIILSISVLPLADLLGSGQEAARWDALVVAVYTLAINVLFARRVRKAGLHWGGWWAISALGVNVTAVIIAGIVIATGSFGAFEVMLVVLLIRPMIPFLLVLESWETETHRPKPG